MNEPTDITRITLARGLFYRDTDYIRTRVMDDDYINCFLCGSAIAEGPATFVPSGERYLGPCCSDLAIQHGITRDEYGSHRPSHMGRVLSIPAGAVIPLAEMIAIRNERNAER